MTDPILITAITSAILSGLGILVTLLTKIKIKSSCLDCFDCLSTPTQQEQT